MEGEGGEQQGEEDVVFPRRQRRKQRVRRRLRTSKGKRASASSTTGKEGGRKSRGSGDGEADEMVAPAKPNATPSTAKATAAHRHDPQLGKRQKQQQCHTVDGRQQQQQQQATSVARFVETPKEQRHRAKPSGESRRYSSLAFASGARPAQQQQNQPQHQAEKPQRSHKEAQPLAATEGTPVAVDLLSASAVNDACPLPASPWSHLQHRIAHYFADLE